MSTHVSPPLPGPAKAADYLAHFCFERSKRASALYTYGIPLLVLSILLSLLVGLDLWRNPPTEGSGGKGLVDLLLSPFATLGLLFAGLWQWRSARREISMEKYYERLDISNQWWKSSPPVQRMMAGFSREPEDPEMTMYVCLEIDNLEYIIEKYRIGYVDEEQACRALKAFQIRCLSSSEFKQIARRRIHLGDYTCRTARVVCRICDEVDNLIEHHLSSCFATGAGAATGAAAGVAAGSQTDVRIGVRVSAGASSPPPPPFDGARMTATEAPGPNPRRRASDVLPFRSGTGPAPAAASSADAGAAVPVNPGASTAPEPAATDPARQIGAGESQPPSSATGG